MDLRQQVPDLGESLREVKASVQQLQSSSSSSRKSHIPRDLFVSVMFIYVAIILMRIKLIRERSPL